MLKTLHLRLSGTFCLVHFKQTGFIWTGVETHHDLVLGFIDQVTPCALRSQHECKWPIQPTKDGKWVNKQEVTTKQGKIGSFEYYYSCWCKHFDAASIMFKSKVLETGCMLYKWALCQTEILRGWEADIIIFQETLASQKKPAALKEPAGLYLCWIEFN